MTARFEIHFMIDPTSHFDSRGMKFPVNKLHPNKEHLISRIRGMYGFKDLRHYEEDHVSVIVDGGDLDKLQAVVLEYLTKQRSANVSNVIRKQIELLGRSHTGSLTNYLNGVEE